MWCNPLPPPLCGGLSLHDRPSPPSFALSNAHSLLSPPPFSLSAITLCCSLQTRLSLPPNLFSHPLLYPFLALHNPVPCWPRLSPLLDQLLEDRRKCLIFTRSREKADDLTKVLRSCGYPALVLPHRYTVPQEWGGTEDNPEFMRVVEEFQLPPPQGSPILVTCDVVARGVGMPVPVLQPVPQPDQQIWPQRILIFFQPQLLHNGGRPEVFNSGAGEALKTWGGFGKGV